MKFYDFYYRLKGDKKAPIMCRTFTAHTKESAKLMAKGVISKDYVVVDIKTS